MTQSRIVCGTIVAVALGILGSSAGADHYIGPRKVGDKCYKVGLGSNGAFGHWETCSDSKSGATASAKVSKGANKKSTGSSSGSASRSAPGE
jgi:hypothetical protein